MQNDFLSHADAARRNRNNILHYIRKYGPVSRTDIWEQLDISRASVTQIVRQLQESNLILETGEGESTGGRKPQYIMFNNMAKKLYAFDWSCRTLFLMNLGGEILYEKKLSFDTDVTPTAFAMVLEKEISAIEKEHLCEPEEIIGLGISLPGVIDSENAVVVNSVEVGWQNVSLKSLFRSRFSENIYVDRSGNLMALGEYSCGLAKGVSHFQLLILGSDGIGVSTIIRDGCQHGANCMHGELGHIKMPNDVKCSCGQRGCLEAVIKEEMSKSGGKLTNEVLEYLAIGVSTVINISDVSVAMLVGSYVNLMTQKQKSAFVEMIRNKLTSSRMRKLSIYFSQDTKRMTLNGICSQAFGCYFSTK